MKPLNVNARHNQLIWLYSQKFYVLKAMFVPWVYSFSLVQLNHQRDSLLFPHKRTLNGHPSTEQGNMKERCNRIIEHISVFVPCKFFHYLAHISSYRLPIYLYVRRNESYVSILKVNETSQFEI